MEERLLRYLKNTCKNKLVFKENAVAEALVGYADADFASDEFDRKSTSGFLFKVFGNCVSWSSKKQSVVACSTTEAEYISLSNATQEAVWLKGILTDMKVEVGPVTLFEDNQSCIKMAENLESKTYRC